MLLVGIVAEGVSDWMVLEAVMRNVHPEIEFRRIQPDQALAPRLGQGWRGVRNWCEEYGPQLETLMKGPSPNLDLLIIHTDCSMADKANAERPCPPASDTAEALRSVIKSWLNRYPAPPFVIMATPSKSSDAWVVATLDPQYAKFEEIECDKGAEDELVMRKFLRVKDGQVKKPGVRYEPLARAVGLRLDAVCNACTQASAFRMEFALAVIWQLWTR
jgi:hypothetical protein